MLQLQKKKSLKHLLRLIAVLSLLLDPSGSECACPMVRFTGQRHENMGNHAERTSAGTVFYCNCWRTHAGQTEKAGVANLVATMMNEGTKNKTPEQLEDAIGLLGATIRVTSGNEDITVDVSTLAKNFEKTVAFAREILLEPDGILTVCSGKANYQQSQTQRCES